MIRRIGIICGPNIDKLPPYLHAIKAAGAEGVVFQAGQCQATNIVTTVDGWLLPGGGDIDPTLYSDYSHPTISGVDRARDQLEKDIILYSHQNKIPMLGICRGIQTMAWALGGRLYQDIDAEMPPEATPKHHRHSPNGARNILAHSIDIAPRTKLANIVQAPSIQVNSIHHQAVKEVPPGFVVSARAPDGLIEAMEDPQHPWFIGVQWHPEELLGPWIQLFEELVRQSRRVSGQS